MAPKIVATLLLAVCTTGILPFQDKPEKPAPTAQEEPAKQSSPKTMTVFGLSEDTPVRLRLNRTVSSATEKLNDRVDFEVIEDVKVRDIVVVPRGSIAIATVTEAKPKGRMGKAGKLNVNIDYVQLPTGDKITLRAVQGGSGGTHTAVMTGAIVASAIVFFPAAPFFLFMHGKDITIPKGTEITAYVAADIPLDQAKFTLPAPSDVAGQATQMIGDAKPASAQQAPLTLASSGSSDSGASPIIITSEPNGADITIDGKYMGTTGSTVQLMPGSHEVLVERSGYKKWLRTLTVVSGGTVTVKAVLEKQS